jgi:hypothetical protein
VSVSLFAIEALKETLVDGVEESLLFRVVLDRRSCLFDGFIEGVEFAEEFVAAKVVAGERVNDLLDFSGDDVAAGELPIAEYLAEDALGKEVLNKHLFDGFVF